MRTPSSQPVFGRVYDRPVRWHPYAIAASLFLAWLAFAQGEKLLCVNRRAHDSSSLSYTFSEIDDECTRLHFFPFTRPR